MITQLIRHMCHKLWCSHASRQFTGRKYTQQIFSSIFTEKSRDQSQRPQAVTTFRNYISSSWSDRVKHIHS